VRAITAWGQSRALPTLCEGTRTTGEKEEEKEHEEEKVVRGFGYPLCKGGDCCIVSDVHRLTKHEQLVLCIAVGLLALGWTVKVYRAAHPPMTKAEQTKR
jgi:hypothetical protein